MLFGSQTGLKHREREVDHVYLTAYTPTRNFANSTSTYEQTLLLYVVSFPPALPKCAPLGPLDPACGLVLLHEEGGRG